MDNDCRNTALLPWCGPPALGSGGQERAREHHKRVSALSQMPITACCPGQPAARGDSGRGVYWLLPSLAQPPFVMPLEEREHESGKGVLTAPRQLSERRVPRVSGGGRLWQLLHPDRLNGVRPKMLAVTLFGRLQSGCPPEKGGGALLLRASGLSGFQYMTSSCCLEGKLSSACLSTWCL